MMPSENKTYLVIGAGQEHRLGRWEKIKEAKNRWRSVELVVKEKGEQKSGEAVSSTECSENGKVGKIKKPNKPKEAAEGGRAIE